MARTGIFPIIRTETYDSSAATTWGDDTTTEVGVIKITGAGAITFDSTNYPGEGGDCVIVCNTTGTSENVLITPDPFSDATMDTTALAAGESVAVVYHPVNGWMWLGGVQSA